MKKLFLLAIGAGLSVGATAQRVSGGHSSAATPIDNISYLHNNINARTTATGDTFTLSNVSSTDTATIYFAGATSDSGFVSGTDAYGDMGYAERYDFGTTDSALKVIGVVSLFGGTVNPASSKTVKFYTWSQGAETALTGSTTIFESGFPSAALDSVTVPITQLGIDITGAAQDTFKSFFFTTPTAYLTQSFFVGYTINYSYTALAGDTIALFNSEGGERTSPIAFLSGSDTIINNQNATLFSDGTWHDNATDNFQIQNDFYIFPIVIVQELATTGVKGITKNNFTFFGNYPNPAVNSTNIDFSLATTAGVTITVMDMAGHTVNTIQQNNLAPGTHTINLATSDMAAGDYLYLVRTTEGDGFASKLSVIK